MSDYEQKLSRLIKKLSNWEKKFLIRFIYIKFGKKEDDD